MSMRRTNIEIDEQNLERVKKITGATTAKAAVNAALAELVRIERQRKVLAHRGIGGWEGDLDALRRDARGA